MPVLKENTIDKTWVHNRDVKTSNASSFVPYRKVLSYLKQRYMVLICSCGANHFLLYYFVLTSEESCIRPLILPHFKQVEPDVCFFFFFFGSFFVLSRRFVIFVCLFVLVFLLFLFRLFTLQIQHSVHTDSTYFIQFWTVFRRPLSLSKSDITKSIVPILYMWDV